MERRPPPVQLALDPAVADPAELPPATPTVRPVTAPGLATTRGPQAPVRSARGLPQWPAARIDAPDPPRVRDAGQTPAARPRHIRRSTAAAQPRGPAQPRRSGHAMVPPPAAEVGAQGARSEEIGLPPERAGRPRRSDSIHTPWPQSGPVAGRDDRPPPGSARSIPQSAAAAGAAPPPRPAAAVVSPPQAPGALLSQLPGLLPVAAPTRDLGPSVPAAAQHPPAAARRPPPPPARVPGPQAFAPPGAGDAVPDLAGAVAGLAPVRHPPPSEGLPDPRPVARVLAPDRPARAPSTVPQQPADAAGPAASTLLPWPELDADPAAADPTDRWPALPAAPARSTRPAAALALAEQERRRRLDLEQRGTPWNG